MFTGIVTHQAYISDVAVVDTNGSVDLCLKHDLPTLEQGESVAVDGVCLTAVILSPNTFKVNISSETLEKTTLNGVSVGGLLHLEKPLTLSAPIGGHVVTGHVDETLFVGEIHRTPDYATLTFEGVSHPEWVVEKGSVAIDGVSLTVNRVDDEQRCFDCVLIPHTLSVTHLVNLSKGDKVNVEYDYLAKVVAKQVSGGYLGFRSQRNEP